MWFIKNAIRHNTPANPNVVLSWRGHWSLLPECPLRARIYEHLLASMAEVSGAYAEAFEKACGKASAEASPKGTAKQEQEAGSRKQEKKTSPSSARPTIPCPYQSIVDLYHEKLHELPRVKLLPESRQKALRKFWGWVLSCPKTNGEPRATDADEALQYIGTYFDHASHNDFLMGRTARSPEHANWRCDLDFLLTDKGKKQVIEKTEVAA